MYFAGKFLSLADKAEGLNTLEILRLKSLVWSFMEVDKRISKNTSLGQVSLEGISHEKGHRKF